MNYGWQEDGSFYMPPDAAKEFSKALLWLSHSEGLGGIQLPVSNTVKHIRNCVELMYEEFDFSHEEYC